MLPKVWKKSFINGVVIPTKIGHFEEFEGKIVCDRCSFQVNENKEFEGNLNLLKRKPLSQFGHMLPYYK